MPYIALSVHLDAVLHPVDACRDLSGSFFCGFPQSHEKNTIYGFADKPACTPTCTVVNSFASESDDQLSLQWSIFTCLGNGLVNTVAGNASSHAYTTTIQQRLVETSHLAETCRHFSWRQGPFAISIGDRIVEPTLVLRRPPQWLPHIPVAI